MKQLHHKVNIIPIIGKADTIARSELGDFKSRVCKNKMATLIVYSSRQLMLCTHVYQAIFNVHCVI